MRAVLLIVVSACGRLSFEPPIVAADDGGSDGTIAPVTCGTTVRFSEDFTGTTASPNWNVNTGAGITISQGGGMVTMTFANNVMANENAMYTQNSSMDFRGVCVVAEIPGILNAGTTAYSWYAITNGPGGIGFEVVGGVELYAFHYVDSATGTGLSSATFSLAQYRFVRIHENAGTFTWHTSGDGVTFVPFTSAPVDIDISSSQFQFGVASGMQNAMNAGTAIVGRVTELGP